MKRIECGFALLEAIVALMMVFPVVIYGWYLASFYQMHHELGAIIDSQFSFGARPEVSVVALDKGVVVTSANLQQLFAEKLIRLRERICRGILRNQSCDTSIQLTLNYKGALYGISGVPSRISSSVVNLADDQIIVEGIIHDQFENMRNMSLNYIDTRVIVQRRYGVRGGLSWVG